LAAIHSSTPAAPNCPAEERSRIVPSTVTMLSARGSMLLDEPPPRWSTASVSAARLAPGMWSPSASLPCS
jgi:hypothetical protein